MVGKKVKLSIMSIMTAMVLFLGIGSNAQAATYYYQTQSTGYHSYIVVTSSPYYQKRVTVNQCGYQFDLLYTYYYGCIVKVCILNCHKVPQPQQPQTDNSDHSVVIESNN